MNIKNKNNQSQDNQNHMDKWKRNKEHKLGLEYDHLGMFADIDKEFKYDLNDEEEIPEEKSFTHLFKDIKHQYDDQPSNEFNIHSMNNELPMLSQDLNQLWVENAFHKSERESQFYQEESSSNFKQKDPDNPSEEFDFELCANQLPTTAPVWFSEDYKKVVEEHNPSWKDSEQKQKCKNSTIKVLSKKQKSCSKASKWKQNKTQNQSSRSASQKKSNFQKERVENWTKNASLTHSELDSKSVGRVSSKKAFKTKSQSGKKDDRNQMNSQSIPKAKIVDESNGKFV